MPIRAVIFDRDNTLMHFDADAIASVEARIAQAAPGLPQGAAVAHWMGWSEGWPRTPADEPAFWSAFWNSLAARYQLPSGAAAALLQIGDFYHTCFSVFSDSVGCLDALRSRGLHLALLTNFELPSIDLTLRHTGIDPLWFAVLISSATIGFHKPDPRAYQAVVAALNLHPAECAFVDDLPENIAAARALGMPAWLLDRRGTATPDKGPRIRSLDELPQALQLF